MYNFAKDHEEETHSSMRGFDIGGEKLQSKGGTAEDEKALPRGSLYAILWNFVFILNSTEIKG